MCSEAQSQEIDKKLIYSEGHNPSNIQHNIGKNPKEFDWMFNSCKFDYSTLENANLKGFSDKVDLSNAKKVKDFFQPFFLHCNRKILPYLEVNRFKQTNNSDLEDSVFEIAHKCGFYRDDIYIRLLYSVYVLGSDNVKKSRNFTCGNYWQSSCHITSIDSLFKYQAIPYATSGSNEYVGSKFSLLELDNLEKDEVIIDFKRLGITKTTRDFCNNVKGWNNG